MIFFLKPRQATSSSYTSDYSLEVHQLMVSFVIVKDNWLNSAFIAQNTFLVSFEIKFVLEGI